MDPTTLPRSPYSYSLKIGQSVRINRVSPTINSVKTHQKKVCHKSTVTMRLKPSLLLFNKVSFAVVGGQTRTICCGGWHPIKNIRDSHVREIGEFAVSKFNEKTKATLKFERVVDGESQVVAGKNYRLIVAEKDGGVSNKYEAFV